MPPKKQELGVSLLVRLPPEASAAQARALSKAFETVLVDFGRAMQIPGRKLKVEAIQGPAEPIHVDEVTGTGTVPAVVLAHRTRPSRST